MTVQEGNDFFIRQIAESGASTRSIRGDESSIRTPFTALIFSLSAGGFAEPENRTMYRLIVSGYQEALSLIRRSKTTDLGPREY